MIVHLVSCTDFALLQPFNCYFLKKISKYITANFVFDWNFIYFSIFKARLARWIFHISKYCPSALYIIYCLVFSFFWWEINHSPYVMPFFWLFLIINFCVVFGTILQNIFRNGFFFFILFKLDIVMQSQYYQLFLFLFLFSYSEKILVVDRLEKSIYFPLLFGFLSS